MTEVLLALFALGFLMRMGRRWKGGAGDEPESLPAVLARAEAAGIITTVQREQILAHAGERRSGTLLGGAGWLGVFAGLFVVAGVSLLIARNWEDIGALIRIGVFLVTLLVVGEGAIRSRARALGLSVPLELLWLFLPLLGIGLYAQTFQLSGDPIQPFLVWLALTAPLAWLSPRPVVASIHTCAMVAVLFTGNFVLDATAALLGGGNGGPLGMLALTRGASRPLAWVLSALLLGAITLQSLRLLPPAHRHHVVGVWALWVFALLVAPTSLRLHHERWIVVAAVALATLWIVVLATADASTEERAPGTLVWLGTLYALTFTWHMDAPADGDVTNGGVTVVVLAVLAACGGALALPTSRLSPLPGWARAGKLVLVAPVLVALLYLLPDVRFVWVAALLMNLILVGSAVGFMWHGSLVRDVLQINLGVLVLIGVLITRFLDVFGDMLRSGIGFIVAGILLAALSWALERTRRRLIGIPREATP